MATLFCPISGIRYTCDHLPLHLTMPHPIFSFSRKQLLPLYSKYLAGHLSDTDNYLLFLAYLNTIDSLTWRTPCSLDPKAQTTQAMIANNIGQLLSVLEKTMAIALPSFKQPGYVITKENSDLSNIAIYIKAWEDNIEGMLTAYRQERIDKELTKIEDKLQYLIFAGEKELSANKLAEWASLAASFPKHKKEAYKKVIRSCYNQNKMFSYKLKELEEVKDWCLESIMPGSIYLHKLIEVLDYGINLNKSFVGYTILSLSDSSSQEAKELAILTAKAPEKEPIEIDYPSKVEYIRAKLRWNLAKRKGESTV